MHELYANDHIRISYDVGNDWLYADWAPEQTAASVWESGEALLRLVRQHYIRRVLNDNRRIQTMWSDPGEWASRVWFPALADAGVEYFAWVYAPELFNRLFTDAIIEPVQRPVVLPFDDFDTACRWLRAV